MIEKETILKLVELFPDYILMKLMADEEWKE